MVSRQMAGLYVTVWAKSPLDSSIRNVKVSCVGCGIMGYLGNKGSDNYDFQGSISISMSLHHSTFCFVCAHLASGQNQGDLARRNSDVAEILKRTNFSRKISSIHSPRTIMGHECDRILWYSKGLKEISYERGEYIFSDHRPVSAIFTTAMDVLCNRKVEKSLSLSIKLMEAEDLLYPDIVKLPVHIQSE
ncbi:hypothetical protein KI387_003656 [Taxus chinensis]|uniref:Inositol polyphosphate-related phosphatase domain-containing protein n=1 Tax=Taxus chinensis TaxID=29808 RepID=A0AA38LNE2_TAXCH|nr:hypothetical protein KI387_003656 [Taxus chinensis]